MLPPSIKYSSSFPDDWTLPTQMLSPVKPTSEAGVGLGSGKFIIARSDAAFPCNNCPKPCLKWTRTWIRKDQRIERG